MTEKFKRNKPKEEEIEYPEVPVPVSAGAVEKAMDLAFNPTREKLREVTIIDKIQARLFPVIDMVNTGLGHCLQIAYYRENPKEYKKLFKKNIPVIPDLLDELLYRTAQWQKSEKGTNLNKITDIALAETETKSDSEGMFGSEWGND